MALYQVTLPVAGRITFEIEADDEDAAIEKALREPERNGDLEYEILENLMRGNCCMADCTEPEVECLEPDEEEDEDETDTK